CWTGISSVVGVLRKAQRASRSFASRLSAPILLHFFPVSRAPAAVPRAAQTPRPTVSFLGRARRFGEWVPVWILIACIAHTPPGRSQSPAPVQRNGPVQQQKPYALTAN